MKLNQTQLRSLIKETMGMGPTAVGRNASLVMGDPHLSEAIETLVHTLAEVIADRDGGDADEYVPELDGDVRMAVEKIISGY